MKTTTSVYDIMTKEEMLNVLETFSELAGDSGITLSKEFLVALCKKLKEK